MLTLAMTLSLGTWLAGGGAALAACDDDGDGYDDVDSGDTGCGEDLDCDGTDDTVNPDAEEVIGDGVDNDCTGLVDVVRRPYARAWWSLAGIPPSEWSTETGSVDYTTDRVVFNPGSAKIALDGPYRWDNGRLVVSTYFKGMPGPLACTVSVLPAGGSPQTVLVGVGYYANAFAVTPPVDIDKITVGCTVTGPPMELDWFALSDGDYEWAPATDQLASGVPLSLPYGGSQTSLAVAEDGSGCFVGSDVAGVAFAADCQTWRPINGSIYLPGEQVRLNAMSLYAPDQDTLT